MEEMLKLGNVRNVTRQKVSKSIQETLYNLKRISLRILASNCKIELP